MISLLVDTMTLQ